MPLFRSEKQIIADQKKAELTDAAMHTLQRLNRLLDVAETFLQMQSHNATREPDSPLANIARIVGGFRNEPVSTNGPTDTTD